MGKRMLAVPGELGLGIRFKNLWNGTWVHLRFCSAFCEANHELDRANQNRQTKWLSYLGSTRRPSASPA